MGKFGLSSSNLSPRDEYIHFFIFFHLLDNAHSQNLQKKNTMHETKNLQCLAIFHRLVKLHENGEVGL